MRATHPRGPVVNRQRLKVLVLFATIAVLATSGLLAFRRDRDTGNAGIRRQVFFRGEVVATVDEAVGPSPVRKASERVRRTTRLESQGSTTLTADLDSDGLTVAADYVRSGERSASLRPDGGVVIDGRQAGVVEGPVVLLELLHRVRLTKAREVTLLELSSFESRRVTLRRQGPAIVAVVDGEVLVRALPEGLRTGPGAFAEGDDAPELPGAVVNVALEGVTSMAGARLGGPARTLPALDRAGGDADRLPGPFIESDADAVTAFARPLCRQNALETARLVGEAVKSRVDPRATAVAPSAVRMLAAGGDCDGAAALATAALRACGHLARALVGYRLVDSGTQTARLVPHALTEVYVAGDDGETTPGRWWRLDATVPTLTDTDTRFLAVAEGLGGSLTMGRLLGVIDASDVILGTPAVQEPDARP